MHPDHRRPTTVSGSGRISKQTIAKRDDQIALEKIRNVVQGQAVKVYGIGNDDDNTNDGDLVGGKYGHLSVPFMRKYSLGHRFRREKLAYERMLGSFVIDDDADTVIHDKDDIAIGVGGVIMDDDSKDLVVTHNKRDKDGAVVSSTQEQEKDWVVMAFTDENSSLPFATILRNNGNKPGNGYSNENDHHRRKLITLLEAAVSSRMKYHYPSVLLTASKLSRGSVLHTMEEDRDSNHEDQDGKVDNGDGQGRGVWGRLRAVSATSYIPSRILGAYPGDAPPIEEAGNANGVLDLARRYGYGDWSDDEDNQYNNDSDSDNFGVAELKTQRNQRHGKKRRKSRVSNKNQSESYRGTHSLGKVIPSAYNEGDAVITGKRRKTRRRKPPQCEEGRASISFSVGSSASLNTASAMTTRRVGVRKNRRATRGTGVEASTFRSSIRRRNMTDERRVRPPMERTMELNASLSKRGEKSNIRSGSSIDHSSRDKRIRPTFRPPRDPSVSVLSPMRRTQAMFHEDKKDN